MLTNAQASDYFEPDPAQLAQSLAESHQLLAERNTYQATYLTNYPPNKLIYQWFEEQSERTPDAIAIVDGDQKLTYRALNQRANQLAHYLIHLGVQAETRIGICMNRSSEMVIGLLGILKAGAAYVPMDPTYPQERLIFTVEDAEMSFLLTQNGLTDSLVLSRVQRLCIDTDATLIEFYSTANPATPIQPQQLAYIIYTSGSTGRPKGVAIEHRNTSALIDWAKGFFTAEQMRGVLAATSLCFDLSVFEIFVTLSFGGTIILAENALELPSLPQATEVTLINTVPSAIAALLHCQGIPTSVTTVNLAGEPLQPQIVQQLYALEHIQQVYNLYGPSEDTTYSTVALMPRHLTEMPSIGQPITHTQIYLIDPQVWAEEQSLKLSPDGTVGEIYIGGAGLARGYFNQPELTAERFIADPFSADPTARLYKTGDLAVYLPDGNLKYLGRLDHQVKIRGFRVELGEIEAVLSQCAIVQDAAVVVQEDDRDKCLVAYVVLNQDQEDAVQQIRLFLQERLPAYMLPSQINILEAFPLTPSGKVDRKALQAPIGLRPKLSVCYVPPETPLQQQIAAIWRQVLRLDRVGLHDNFFELGGTSILAMQMMTGLQRKVTCKLRVVTLYQYPTVAALAEFITQASASESTDCSQTDATNQSVQLRAQRQRMAQQSQRIRRR